MAKPSAPPPSAPRNSARPSTSPSTNRLSKGITSFRRRRLAVRHGGRLQEDGRQSRAAHAHLDDAARTRMSSSPPIWTATASSARATTSTVRAIKRADRWRPRLARRLAARALHRQAGQQRPQHRRPGRHPQDRRARHRSTAISSACTPSATAPIARVLNIYEETFQASIPTRRTCAGASSTRSTSTPPIFRASASWA